MESILPPQFLHRIFSEEYRLIDVRSPGEFHRGQLPGSHNAPLLTDDERASVGICYRQQGAEAAIALGHSIVRGAIKSDRIAAWQRLRESDATSLIFCARGGLRSKIASEWLTEKGTPIDRIEGGYKAIRRALLDWFNGTIASLPIAIVSGQTGVGKTHFLKRARHGCRFVDLEGLANHCGSSFGEIYGPQPSQATFENSLFVSTLRAHHGLHGPLLVEDESRRIGAVTLPLSLLERLKSSPRIVLTRPLPERIENIKKDYIHSVLARGGENAMDALETSLTQALQRIGRRLGDERLRLALALLGEAFAVHRAAGTTEGHDRWISLLLTEYYDPSYARQLKACKETVLAEGSEAELASLLHSGKLDPLLSPR